VHSSNIPIRFVLGLALALCLLIALPIGDNSASAIELKAGDIIVADINALSHPSHSPPNGGVFRVDPDTGEQTIISALGEFASATDVVIESSGSLLVSDFDRNAIFRVDPITGDQTVLSSGGLLNYFPEQIVIDSSGNLIVAVPWRGIVHVDTTTGAQTLILGASPFQQVYTGVALDRNGDIIVADLVNNLLLKIDSATGLHSVLATGLFAPRRIAISDRGEIFVTNGERVFRVDPDTGQWTVVATLPSCFGIAIDANGDLIIAIDVPGQVVKVDPLSGASEIVSAGGYFENPSGVAIVPRSVIDVGIDIKPGNDPNSINPTLEGDLPVAILGLDSLDVAEVDATTLTFGPNEAPLDHSHGPHFEDVNGDGFTDLLAHFRIEQTGIEFGDMEACIHGKMVDGTAFEGCDAIRTVPDMDGDGLLDIDEEAIGTDALLWDTDGDGFGDGEEVYVMGTDPLDALDPAPASVARGPKGGRRRH